MRKILKENELMQKYGITKKRGYYIYSNLGMITKSKNLKELIKKVEAKKELAKKFIGG